MKITNTEIVEELNHLMAEEIEAFLRYFQMRYRVQNPQNDFFDKAMEETVEHAEAIAEHIRTLGQVPRLNIKLTVGGTPINFKEALSEALIFEQQALDAYKDTLPRVKGNPKLEEFIRLQIATESEHVAEIRALLK